jgi:hypothetical protein
LPSVASNFLIGVLRTSFTFQKNYDSNICNLLLGCCKNKIRERAKTHQDGCATRQNTALPLCFFLGEKRLQIYHLDMRFFKYQYVTLIFFEVLSLFRTIINYIFIDKKVKKSLQNKKE